MVQPRSDFFTDASYELALFIMETVHILDNLAVNSDGGEKDAGGQNFSTEKNFISYTKKNQGLLLTAVPYICSKSSYHNMCAMYPQSSVTSLCVSHIIVLNATINTSVTHEILQLQSCHCSFSMDSHNVHSRS